MICHPFPPIYDGNSRILILGSFPSVKSREQLFFYGHPQNRFWRVTAAVYGSEAPGTIPEKKEFLLSHGIALWDVIASCEITGSSDSSIKNVAVNDFHRFSRLPISSGYSSMVRRPSAFMTAIQNRLSDVKRQFFRPHHRPMPHGRLISL